MKKSLLTILVLILSICILSGCVPSNTYNPFRDKEKPCNNYYTMELKNTLASNNPKKSFMFYREFFRELTFPETEVKDIISFVDTLNDDCFIDKPSDLPDTYVYKVYLEFNDRKFAMTIYNEKYISIYEWDGDYAVDYLDISSVPLSLNIYGICNNFK